MSLTTLTPTFTFRELYDDYNQLVEYFNSKELIMDSYPLKIDTSGVANNLFGFIDSNGNVQAAYAQSRDKWADFYILTTDIDGDVIQFGTALGALVENGIDIFAGDLLYLTEDELWPGRVTNVPTAQYIGKAINNSVSGSVDLWYKTADSYVTLTNTDEFTDGSDFTSGSTTELTLSTYPPSVSNVEVYFDGVHQLHSTFSLSENVLTFNPAITATKVEVTIRYGENFHNLVAEIDSDQAHQGDVHIVTGNTTAVNYGSYVINAADIIIEMPPNPLVGYWVNFFNAAGGTGSVIRDTVEPILSSTEDLTIDIPNITFTLIYADETQGWVLI